MMPIWKTTLRATLVYLDMDPDNVIYAVPRYPKGEGPDVDRRPYGFTIWYKKTPFMRWEPGPDFIAELWATGKEPFLEYMLKVAREEMSRQLSRLWKVTGGGDG
jgi:hypothetical protein